MKTNARSAAPIHRGCGFPPRLGARILSLAPTTLNNVDFQGGNARAASIILSLLSERNKIRILHSALPPSAVRQYPCAERRGIKAQPCAKRRGVKRHACVSP